MARSRRRRCSVVPGSGWRRWPSRGSGGKHGQGARRGRNKYQVSSIKSHPGLCWLVLFCAARSCSLRAQLSESCGRKVSSAAREWGWGWRGWEGDAGWSIVPPAPRRQRAVRSKERRSTSYGARHKAIAGQGHSQGSTRVKQSLRARVSTKNEEQEQEQSAAHSEASFQDSRLTGGGLLYEAPDEVRGPLARSSTPVATRASIVQPVSPDGRSLPCEGTSTIRGTLCDPGA